MVEHRGCTGDRVIQWTTTLSVVVLAGIAAVLSYKHMYVLVRRYGETSWVAALSPVSLLADSRQSQQSQQSQQSRHVIANIR